METKLTLKLDHEIIERAKLHARKQSKSLSALTEDLYRNAIEGVADTPRQFSGIAGKYKGILRDAERDLEDMRFEHLKDKHLA